MYTLLRTTEKALRRFFCLQFYTCYKLFMHIFEGCYSDKIFYDQNLAGLPTVKAGITELTFSGGNTTLTHNASFPDTNYAVMFICDNVRMFPRMSTNLDGNKTTLSASAVNGAGAIANLDGKYRVMWIVARST